MRLTQMQRRITAETEFQTRSENEGPVIEGYFAVFNSNYQMCDYMSESIAQGAFRDALQADVRALINHDSTLVLGRTTAGTLELREDEHGLWGKIRINPHDSDAMNIYERIRRGDVSQCSFGFEILDETSEQRADGSIHWTIRKVRLHEVSCVTFPAYEQTAIHARQKDYEAIQRRKLDKWRETMQNRLKTSRKEQNYAESIDVTEKN